MIYAEKEARFVPLFGSVISVGAKAAFITEFFIFFIEVRFKILFAYCTFE